MNVINGASMLLLGPRSSYKYCVMPAEKITDHLHHFFNPLKLFFKKEFTIYIPNYHFFPTESPPRLFIKWFHLQWPTPTVSLSHTLSSSASVNWVHITKIYQRGHLDMYYQINEDKAYPAEDDTDPQNLVTACYPFNKTVIIQAPLT